MSNHLGKHDLGLLLERLTSVFDKPFGARAETILDEWFKVLRWLPSKAVTDAVDHWLATKDRMPKPAQIAAMVRDQLDKSRPVGAVPIVSGCQQCGTEDQLRAVPRRALSTPDNITWTKRGLCDCQFRAQVRTWDGTYLVDLDDPIVAAELRRRAQHQRGAA